MLFCKTFLCGWVKEATWPAWLKPLGNPKTRSLIWQLNTSYPTPLRRGGGSFPSRSSIRHKNGTSSCLTCIFDPTQFVFPRDPGQIIPSPSNCWERFVLSVRRLGWDLGSIFGSLVLFLLWNLYNLYVSFFFLAFFLRVDFLRRSKMVQATFRTASSLVFTNWPDLYPGRKLCQFFVFSQKLEKWSGMGGQNLFEIG